MVDALSKKVPHDPRRFAAIRLGWNAPGSAVRPGEQGTVSINLRLVRRTPVRSAVVSASTQTKQLAE